MTLPSEDQRQQAVDALSEHFAADRLTLEEFERRVAIAHRTRALEELESLLRDLPSGNVPALRPDSPLPAGTERVKASVVADRVPTRNTLVAMFGSSVRKGRWVPARKTRSVAVLGSVSLDFREALLGPGVTDVDVYVILGSVEVIVPPGLYVECTGAAILGSFEQANESPPSLEPDAPVLRINGIALLGSVEVQVRKAGESARDARRRERAERKRLPGR